MSRSTKRNLRLPNDDASTSFAFRRYYRQLVQIATFSMRGLDPGPFSASDFAMSAFRSYYRVATQKEYVWESEGALWNFLCQLTRRKAALEKRRQRTLKRGGADLVYLSRKVRLGLNQIADDAPAPDLISETREDREFFLSLFADNPFVSKIVRWKLEGVSSQKIAQKLGVCSRTVNYHLFKAKTRWLFVGNCSDLVAMKFGGFSDEETARELQLPTAWVTFARRGMLKLWSREERDEYNSPDWIQKIERYFDAGKLPDEDDRTKIQLAQNAFYRTADRWIFLIRGRWRRLLEEAWNQFEDAEEDADSSANGNEKSSERETSSERPIANAVANSTATANGNSTANGRAKRRKSNGDVER